VPPRAAIAPVNIPAFNADATSSEALGHVPMGAQGVFTTQFSTAEVMQLLYDSGMTHPRDGRSFSPYEVMLALNLKCPISQGLARCVRASTCECRFVLFLVFYMTWALAFSSRQPVRFEWESDFCVSSIYDKVCAKALLTTSSAIRARHLESGYVENDGFYFRPEAPRNKHREPPRIVSVPPDILRRFVATFPEFAITEFGRNTIVDITGFL
jgi:hypothetical protein